MNSDDARSDGSADLSVNQIIRDYLDSGEPSDAEGFLARHPLSASPAAVAGFREFVAADDVIDRVLKGAVWTRPVDKSPLSLDLPGFELHEVIGRGGMGVVYRARQRSVNRDVALKLLPEEWSADPRRLSRFRNEAQTLAKLQAAHVISVIDVVTSARGPVLVMPFIGGTNLSTIIRDRFAEAKCEGVALGAGPRHPWADLDEADYLRRLAVVFEHLLQALAAVHAENLLHRDVKPSNILIDHRDCAWLSDFGLARDEGSDDFSTPGGSTREMNDTLTGTVAGTNGFISPEGRAGERTDQRSDIFACGITMYQALTGKLPYGRKPITTKASLPDPPSASLSPAVRQSVPHLDAVVLSALHPDPKQRCRSATELLEEWQAVWQSDSARKTRPARSRQGTFLSGRRVSWFAAIAALALCGYYFFDGRSGSSEKSNSGLGAAESQNEQTKVGKPASEPRRGGDPLPFKLSPVGPELAEAMPGEVVPDRTAFCKIDPPDARAVLFPLDDRGNPRTDSAIQPVESGSGELKFAGLPVGWYLLEAAKDGHGFIQVYRRVPRMGELGCQLRHYLWTWEEDSVKWCQVDIVKQEAQPPRMARFADTDIPESGIAPFWLDTMEVTRGEITSVLPRSVVPRLTVGVPDDPSYAARGIAFDVALDYAEKVGKRLPTDREFEFAATNGLRTRFPWGNERFEEEPVWDFGGPVGTPAYDRTNTDPPCFGLMSNVPEWTSTIRMTYPPDRVLRVLRGVPYEVLEGFQPENIKEVDPRKVHWIESANLLLHRYPHLGFRCARSEKPLVVKFDPE